MLDLRLPDLSLTEAAVRLRPCRGTDVAGATRATHAALISRFTRVPPDQTEEDLRCVFHGFESERQAASALTLAIADAQTDEFLGLISLPRFAWDRHTADVGYCSRPGARARRGAAGRAAALQLGVRRVGMARLSLYATTDNYASQRPRSRALRIHSQGSPASGRDARLADRRACRVLVARPRFALAGPPRSLARTALP
jgi:RimJ/RimL family protein N-acetyltransferase